MLVRIIGCVAVVGLAAWALLDQFARLAGWPGQPTLELSVANPVALATFGVATALARGLALDRSAARRPLLAIGLLAMLAPLWLSTRHIYFNDEGATEHGLFLTRRFDAGRSESVCLFERKGMILVVDEKGRELGRMFVGVSPWTVRGDEHFADLGLHCRQGEAGPAAIPY